MILDLAIKARFLSNIWLRSLQERLSEYTFQLHCTLQQAVSADDDHLCYHHEVHTIQHSEHMA
jgi:hypothetical protein